MLSVIRARPLRSLQQLHNAHTRRPMSALGTLAEALPIPIPGFGSSASQPPTTVQTEGAKEEQGPAAEKKRKPKPVKKAASEGPNRPQLNVRVNPSHGLYAFFRKNGEAYETIEEVGKEGSGRSWRAAELRLKSFKDLHTLWYILLRERNLLETQMEEARRMGVHSRNALAANFKVVQCRKSMARIKYVLNERRLAYEGALSLHSEHCEQVVERAAEPIRIAVRKIERARAQLVSLEKQLEVAERGAVGAKGLNMDASQTDASAFLSA